MSSGADFSTPARERLLYQARRYRAEFGRKGLRRKPPMPRRPEAIRRYYYGLIAGIIKAIEAAVNDIIIPELPSLLAAANPTRRDGAERMDAEPPNPDEQWAQRIAALTVATRQQVAERVEAVLGDLMGIGQKTVQHATDDVMRQIRGVIGIDPVYDDALDDLIDSWVQSNSALIKTLVDNQISSVEQIVNRGVRRATPVKLLAQEIHKATGNKLWQAERIARTELGQLYAQTTKRRDLELGLNRFEWVSAGDSRVRDSHAALNGKFFSYDNPPNGYLPGEEINCRCIARAAVDELLAELERAA